MYLIKSMELSYKGSRNYIQGSDIYNAINAYMLEKFGGYLSRLAFKRFARNQIELVVSHPSTSDNILAHGIWLPSHGDRIQFWLRETDQPVIQSYPFDEGAIIEQAFCNVDSICAFKSNDYTLIENIVALTKRLNYLLTPNVDGKWLFGQLGLEREPPTDWNEIKVTRFKIIGNSFSRNRISIDGSDLGEIRFIGGTS